MKELKVISDFYDVTLYLMQRVEKFPRSHRYTLGAEIERRLLAILSLLVQAQYETDKSDLLQSVNRELAVLRFQLRLAGDLGALALRSQGHAASRLHEVGSQVGGWLKSVEARP